jgi:hypothetical protein
LTSIYALHKSRQVFFCSATYLLTTDLYRLVTVAKDYPQGRRSSHLRPRLKKAVSYGGPPMLCSLWATIFSLPTGLDGGHLIQTGISPNATLLTAIAAFLLLLTKI